MTPDIGLSEKEAVFHATFERYYIELRRRIFPFLCDHAAVEDVIQEAFLRLYYRPPLREDNIPAWLFRVAVNLAYNHMRTEDRRRKREGSAARQIVEISDDEVLRREEIGQVRETLARLNPRDRFCLLLRFQGYDYAAIAAVLQIKPGSVGTILARARERFRREHSGKVQEMD